MKNKFCSVFSIVIAAAILFAMLPMSVFAEEAAYTLNSTVITEVSGDMAEQYTAEDENGKVAITIAAFDALAEEDYTLFLHTDGKLHKNDANGDEVTGLSGISYWGSTLTLNGFEFETSAGTALKVPSGTIIEIEGENSIVSTFKGDGASNGITCNGDITISGNGSLTVQAGTNTAGNPSIGISAFGAIEIHGGTIDTTGGDTVDTFSGGLYGYSGIRILDGTVIARGCDTTGIGASAGMAISAGKIEISGGNVTAISGDSAFSDSCGIYAFNNGGGNIEINGGDVTATSGTAGNNSYGITADADIVISGGTVAAKGKDKALNANGDITPAAGYQYRQGDYGDTLSDEWQTGTADFTKQQMLIRFSTNYTLFVHTDGKLHKNNANGDEVTELSGISYWGNTLTLNDFEFETSARTALEVPDGTTIILENDNRITSTCIGDDSFGIYAGGDLTINGVGVITVNGDYNGLQVIGRLTIGGGSEINVNGETNFGIRGNSITINGGTVTAKGDNKAFSVTPVINGSYQYKQSDTDTLTGDWLTGTADFAKKHIAIKTGGVGDSFVAVTDITGASTATTVGTDLNLTGTVTPDNATNKMILWSVKDAGTTGATISNSALKTTAAGTVVITAIITNGATASTNYTKDFTITVVDSGATLTFTVIVSGGGTGALGGGDYAPGQTVTINAGIQTGYTFNGWTSSGVTLADASIATITFTMPLNNVTVIANWTQNSTPAPPPSSSGSSGSSSGSTYTPLSAPTISSMDDKTSGTLNTAINSAADAATNNGSNSFDVNLKNVSNFTKVNAEAIIKKAKALGLSAKVSSDIMSEDGKSVEVRVTLDPTFITKTVRLDGYIRYSQVQTTESKFKKFFSNKTAVVHFGQDGAFGQIARIAAKTDLAGFDFDNLYLYAYDRNTNSYKRIEKPAYRIDSNGYLHFDTDNGGDIIISDGPLERK